MFGLFSLPLPNYLEPPPFNFVPPLPQDQFVLPGCVVDLPGATLLKKTMSLSPSISQLLVGSSTAGVGLCAQLFSPCWDFAWFGPAQVLVCCCKCYGFICTAVLLCPEDTVLPCSHPLALLSLFLPLFLH